MHTKKYISIIQLKTGNLSRASLVFKSFIIVSIVEFSLYQEGEKRDANI